MSNFKIADHYGEPVLWYGFGKAPLGERLAFRLAVTRARTPLTPGAIEHLLFTPGSSEPEAGRLIYNGQPIGRTMLAVIRSAVWDSTQQLKGQVLESNADTSALLNSLASHSAELEATLADIAAGPRYLPGGEFS